MTKKYKVLQNIFDTKKGEILEANEDGELFLFIKRKVDIFKISIPKIDPEAYPQYFELVDDRWKPSTGQGYYYLSFSVRTNHDHWTDTAIDLDRFDNFNMFKTESEAEQARDKVLKTLKKFHEENK